MNNRQPQTIAKRADKRNGTTIFQKNSLQHKQMNCPTERAQEIINTVEKRTRTRIGSGSHALRPAGESRDAVIKELASADKQ